ncbi:MAG: 7-cyano-7-deazaguanine synthase QueC [Candidatus Theseobacter exili]|nr:7-cyano-7-deazaguanine synthase QueC [Candidatus Theseobacter exili]
MRAASQKKAVVLSSGGIDSSVAMAIAKDKGYSIYSITFDYGQRHSCEIEAARRVAESLKVKKHLVFPVNLRSFGGSALTSDKAVPKGRSTEEIFYGIPETYVPARNTIFLSIALGWAETLGIRDIFIGVTAVDYSGYPDCRPEYISAFEILMNLATKAGVEGDEFKIHAPLLNLHKAEIVHEGTRLGMDLGLTHSCYDPGENGRPCGLCDSCLLRQKGFMEAGIKDPAETAREI